MHWRSIFSLLQVSPISKLTSRPRRFSWLPVRVLLPKTCWRSFRKWVELSACANGCWHSSVANLFVYSGRKPVESLLHWPKDPSGGIMIWFQFVFSPVTSIICFNFYFLKLVIAPASNRHRDINNISFWWTLNSIATNVKPQLAAPHTTTSTLRFSTEH